MLRSIMIFSFFAVSTILVIVLQPGPRPTYVYEQSESPLSETSRNQIDVLPEPQPAPALQAPDDVIGKLKAAAEPVRAAPQQGRPSSDATTSGGSLTRLQAALNASLSTPGVVSDAASTSAPALPPTPAPASAQTPEPNLRAAAPTSYPAVAPELRDMSWKTLNALNTLGHKTKGPGQEGSLLNSIVRRSMGQVGNQPLPRPIAAASVVREPVQRSSTAQQTSASATRSSYVVTSGDTLALIAIKLYGSALATDKLLAQNPSLRQNPDALRIGQVLQYSAK